MSTINIGWLKNNNGEKFAPKTLSSQVMTSDGITLEDKIQGEFDNLKEQTTGITEEQIAQIEANKTNIENLSKEIDALKHSGNYVDEEGYLVLGSATTIDTDGYINL